MTQLQADAHARVEAAALALFTERGYAQTTVDEIVARAAVARRTFFRHFASKREILFWGQSALAQAHAQAVASAPADADPLEMCHAALDAAADIMQPRLAVIRRRQAVIRDNVELQERELLKRSELSRALAGALAGREVEPLVAAVTAEAALGAFGIAYRAWVDGAHASLRASVAAALQSLRAATRSPAAA